MEKMKQNTSGAVEEAELNERGVYAFVGWISSIATYVIFLVWAYVPEETLHFVGITYYPPKYVAVAIPAYVLMFALFVVVMYIGLNLIQTSDPDDMITLQTPEARRAPNYYVKCGKKEGIPEIGEMDYVFRSYLIATNGGRKKHSRMQQQRNNERSTSIDG
jgi:hypothetical protein